MVAQPGVCRELPATYRCSTGWGELPWGCASGASRRGDDHDLIFLRFPAYYKCSTPDLYGGNTVRLVGSSTAHCISEATKRDIVDFFSALRPRKSTWFTRLRQSFKREVTDETQTGPVRAQYGLPERYVCGGVSKNVRSSAARAGRGPDDDRFICGVGTDPLHAEVRNFGGKRSCGSGPPSIRRQICDLPAFYGWPKCSSILRRFRVRHSDDRSGVLRRADRRGTGSCLKTAAPMRLCRPGRPQDLADKLTRFLRTRTAPRMTKRGRAYVPFEPESWSPTCWRSIVR